MSSLKIKLFSTAKKASKSKHYKYLWFKNSNLMIKKNEASEIIFINNISDIDNLL